MDREFTAKLIRSHEGTRHVVYLDSEGIMTIGVGFNLERAGARQQINACGANYEMLCAGSSALTSEQVDSLFDDDLDDAIEDALTSVRNFEEHPNQVQAVIVDMHFNLGSAGFRKFKKLIKALEARDYEQAAAEMTDSDWYRQVPNRAAENVELVRRHAEET